MPILRPRALNLLGIHLAKKCNVTIGEVRMLVLVFESTQLLKPSQNFWTSVRCDGWDGGSISYLCALPPIPAQQPSRSLLEL